MAPIVHAIRVLEQDDAENPFEVSASIAEVASESSVGSYLSKSQSQVTSSDSDDWLAAMTNNDSKEKSAVFPIGLTSNRKNCIGVCQPILIR